MRGGFISAPPDIKELEIVSELIIDALSIKTEDSFFHQSQVCCDSM